MILTKIDNFIEYFKYLDNPIEALRFKFGLKNNATIKIKNKDCEIKLTNIYSIDKLMHRIRSVPTEKFEEFINYINEIDNNEELVTINNITYYNILNTRFKETHDSNYTIFIEEYFSDDELNMVSFENRHVIDIGANIADTSLFFAKNNAEVIAFEPVKHIYELGCETISLNPELENKIQYINKAVGGKRGTLTIGTSSTKDYANEKDIYDIDVITVHDVLKEYNFKEDILKMDCEGCEFEIILNEDLTMFNDIIFEHHSEMVNKDYKTLIEKLERENFKCDCYPSNSTKKSFEKIGIIHAHKS